MSQSCNCCPGNTIKVPVRGLELNLDASAFPQPGAGGRIKATADLHIYIDGKLTEAGDGLTPETAVTSVEEAWKALARYDGDNTYEVYVHFADLAKGWRYPDVEIFQGSYSSFTKLHIRGNSYQTTKVDGIVAYGGCYVTVDEIQVSGISAQGSVVDLDGTIGISEPKARIITAGRGGSIMIRGGKLFMYGGSAQALMCAHYNSSVIVWDNANINILGASTFTYGFLFSEKNSTVAIENTSISGASNVSGRKYSCKQLAMIMSAVALPGTAGYLTMDGKFYDSH